MVKPVGKGRGRRDPIETGNRVAAIAGGAVIVVVGLLAWLTFAGLAMGFGEVEANQHHQWYDWVLGYLVFLLLFLPIIVPGAFLIMRGIRGRPLPTGWWRRQWRPDPSGRQWRPDPSGRHQYRYWDGVKWTDQVADNASVSTEPYDGTVARQ